MTAIVTRGDAGNLHLPDATVDLIVTSPPYFGLRSYQDGGEHYAEQIGAEATPAEYLDALMACTAEWMRVLKPGGSIFVNLGDKYANNSIPGNRDTLPQGGRPGQQPSERHKSAKQVKRAKVPTGGIPAKSLMAFPWRYAIRCIDELGLILRAEIVWAKPNGLPESVTDRVRRSHEQVFHFVKQPRYYSAVDEVRTEHKAQDHHRNVKQYEMTHAPGQPKVLMDRTLRNPLGKLPGSVWEIPTSPLRVPEELGIDHFAAYPPELVRRIVLGWSPREVCSDCGEGRRPVTETDLGRKERLTPVYSDTAGINSSARHGKGASTLGSRGPTAVVTGYACACPDTDAPATPGVVLDPFGGTGTTALVASAFGRVGISNDLSADYCRLAQWRTTNPGERARVLGVDKPPVQVDGQLGMFEGIGA